MLPWFKALCAWLWKATASHNWASSVYFIGIFLFIMFLFLLVWTFLSSAHRCPKTIFPPKCCGLTTCILANPSLVLYLFVYIYIFFFFTNKLGLLLSRKQNVVWLETIQFFLWSSCLCVFSRFITNNWQSSLDLFLNMLAFSFFRISSDNSFIFFLLFMLLLVHAVKLRAQWLLFSFQRGWMTNYKIEDSCQNNWRQ